MGKAVQVVIDVGRVIRSVLCPEEGVGRSSVHNILL